MKALFEEVLRHRSDARLLVLTGSLALAAETFGSRPEVQVMRVPPQEVARFLAAGDVGLAYRSDSFSMQGVAPIKVAEYLLCGLPVIGTAAVGDTGPILEAGLLFEGEGREELAARWLVDEILPQRALYRDRARTAGVAQFSLARTIEDYRRALRPFEALATR